jgi:signal transduction histidine kinase
MRLFPDNRLLHYAQRLRRLRYLAIGFLLCLLIPLGTILYFGFGQLQKNLLNEYQREASDLVQFANRTLLKRRMLTNSLSVDAFDYYQQIYNPTTKQSQQVLSPLSQLELVQPISWLQTEGLIGYFQYNANGDFNSPISPYSLPRDVDEIKPQEAELSAELLERKKMAIKVYQITAQSKSIQKTIQQGYIVDKQLFNMALDVPDYLIFYRLVSVAKENRLQGYVVERKSHLSQIFTEIIEQGRFASSVLVKLKDIEYLGQESYFFYQHKLDGQATVTESTEVDVRFQQQTIYHTRLRWPYDSYSIHLSTSSLPMTSAMVYSIIFIIVLIVAILSACYGFYRLGVRQLALAEQRLNFVSSVSHELKTPLTSIRMYSEMLKDGMVISDDYKKDYYEFIYSESERLTRLINNILQLSKLSHQQQTVQPEYVKLTMLQDIIRSKTSSIIDKNNFQQHMSMELTDAENTLVLVEQDAFSQVVINITDNAVKFFDQEQINDVSRQKIDFIFRQHPEHKQLIQLEVRDYGEGITPEQETKIFDLFYRGGNELTRTTQGTGIGLALVNELVLAQQGEIKVERRDPGVAMLISFHAKSIR